MAPPTDSGTCAKPPKGTGAYGAHSTLPSICPLLLSRSMRSAWMYQKKFPASSPETLANDPSKPSAYFLSVSFFKMLLQSEPSLLLHPGSGSDPTPCYIGISPRRMGAMLRTCKKKPLSPFWWSGILKTTTSHHMSNQKNAKDPFCHNNSNKFEIKHLILFDTCLSSTHILTGPSGLNVLRIPSICSFCENWSQVWQAIAAGQPDRFGVHVTWTTFGLFPPALFEHSCLLHYKMQEGPPQSYSIWCKYPKQLNAFEGVTRRDISGPSFPIAWTHTSRSCLNIVFFVAATFNLGFFIYKRKVWQHTFGLFPIR